METWIPYIFSVITAILGSGGLWAYMQKRHDKNDGKSALLIGLAHDRITFLCMKYVERGYITQDEYENLRMYLYDPYVKMGGNGSAKRLMTEVDRLPMTKPNVHTDDTYGGLSNGLNK